VTCIVGLQHACGVTIGGDAAAVEGDRIAAYSTPKVFTVGPFLIGFCDSFRMGQLLAHRLTVPPQRHETDLEYLATTFVDAVRKLFIRHGFHRTNTDNEEIGGVFLLGYRGQLYAIDEDYHVGRYVSGYEALGVGADFALGSLFSTIGAPQARVNQALHASTFHSTSVCPPFTVITQNS